MTSAAAMISGNGGGGAGGGGAGGGEGDTAIRPNLQDSRTSLVPTPDAGSSIGRSSTRSPSASPYSSTSPALPMAGMMMHEPERIRMRGSAAGSKRRRVKDFNDSITCTLCNGYLVEATSVNDCLHSFCRSCIVKYLECNKYCPRCKACNSKPITVTNLRPDRTLSALVYKLVPGLHKAENQRIVQFYASISSNIVPSEDDQPAAGQGTFQLLDDQNFFSPDEPISLSLEYHCETLVAEVGGLGTPLPITYLQCPAAVTVHHLYKFILTKNGLQVGSDNIRVDIIYEEEILPHDFTLMDVAYCYDYKRIAPMRFFYRILIHSTAKLAATASAYHRVEGQDKNSTNSSNSGTGPNTSKPSTKSSATSSSTPTVKTTPAVDGQRPNSTKSKAGQGQEPGGSKPSQPSRAPREDAANNSAPMAATVNGHHQRTKSSTTKTTPATASSEVNRPSATKPSSPGSVASSVSSGLKMVLVPPKAKSETNADAKRSPPPLKAIQAATSAVNGGGATGKQSESKSKEPAASKGKDEATPTPAEAAKSSPNSTLKCYVNLKTQTVVGPPSSDNAHQKSAAESEPQKQCPAEIPRLKIDLKAKLSIPREKNPGLSPPSSSSSSAATSPSSATSATSSTGKSPVWPMGKEEYAKTIGLKPVYASTIPEVPEGNESGSHSSSHRKRKKGKHSKEAGSSGKRRKLHAEISSQHDESLKMKVKLTEKPPKHERLKSSGNEEEVVQPKSPPAPAVVVPEPVPSPLKPTKVIDITKDDDEVKFVNEQKLTQVKSSPPVTPKETAGPLSVPAVASAVTSKEKLTEMRNVRHKPMVYIPNLDRNLSADSAGSGSSINSLLESVGAKTPLLKPTPALIPTSTAASGLATKSQPRPPILSRPMPSCPPLAYPIASSPVTSATTGSIRTMAAPPAIKRSISTDSNGSAAKVPRLEPPSLMPPVSLLLAKQPAPIHAPMFNFAKGANRAKAAQQAAGMAQTQPDHIPYRSPISASYTKEIPSTKKPIPNLLLPPATVSVTKMSDITTSATLSPSPGHESSRPAVEFLRIPSSAPVADKPTLAPFTTPKMSPKTTRPPPATIPLIKIKKPTGTNGNEALQSSGTPPSMTPLSPPMRPKVPPVRPSSDPPAGSSSNILDLSGGAGVRRLSDEVIILDHSPVKHSRVIDVNRSKPSPAVNYSSVKRSPEMMSFSPPTSTSALLSQGLAPVQKTLAPLPKLTEINRHRSLTVRQPNASIRSIPNPSALAFRGSQSGVSTTVSNSAHTSTSTGMQMAGFSSSPAHHTNGSMTGSNRANGNASSATMTSSSTTVKSPGVSLSNGSSTARPMMGISTGSATVKGSNGGGGELKPPTPHNGANGNTAHNNNNSSKVANANAGLGPVKKTIEKVAAVLKAAAATADTTSSQRSMSTAATASTTSSPGSSVPMLGARDVELKGKPPKEDKPSSTASDTLSMATAVSGVNRAVNSSSIVTSVTTASITSVTGTNGSSRSSPASIVNVG